MTIYRRGTTIFLYYRENGHSARRRVDGNLVVARATASKVASALDENKPSPLGFRKLVVEFLSYTANVQNLFAFPGPLPGGAGRFQKFALHKSLKSIDQISAGAVEEFVGWLRTRYRARNGHHNAKKEAYKIGGVKFLPNGLQLGQAGRKNIFSGFGLTVDELRVEHHSKVWAGCFRNIDCLRR